MLGKGLFSLIPKRSSEPEKRDEKLAVGPSIAESAQKFIAKISPPKNNRSGSESVFQIEVEKIKSNPYQPRKIFNEEQLNELASSIREFGILQPLVVTKSVKDTELGTEVDYQLVAGERRLMAAKLLGLERVPVIVRNFEDKLEKLEVALIENLQRENLNPVEEARAYARLQDDFGLTQREIAAQVGKSREVVANRLRLLQLPSNIQTALADGSISESQARVLLAASNPQSQAQAFTVLSNEKLSVRGLEEKVKNSKVIDPQVQYWARRLEDFFGAPVKVSKHGEKGRVIVQFYSEEEWRGIIQKLLGDNLE